MELKNDAIKIKNGKSIKLMNENNTNSIEIKNNNGKILIIKDESINVLNNLLVPVAFDYYFKDNDPNRNNNQNRVINVNKINFNDENTLEHTEIIKKLEEKIISNPSTHTSIIFNSRIDNQNNDYFDLTDEKSIKYKGSLSVSGNLIARVCLASKTNSTNLYSIRISKKMDGGNWIPIPNVISYNKIEDDFYSSGALYLSINSILEANDEMKIEISNIINGNSGNIVDTQIIALQFSFLGYILE